MPFTFSHPAIIVGLSNTKYKFSLTGLIIGSLIPDFEFFFRMHFTENIGHHWYGVFIFDLPLAILFCFFYHNVVRNLLIKNLPYFFKVRFIQYVAFNWNAYAIKYKLLVLTSIFIGIQSHLMWDAFTHYDGFMVLLLPVLSFKVQFIGISVHVYMIFQIVSSIWGLWYIYQYIKALPTNKSISKYGVVSSTYWITIFAVAILVLVGRFLLLAGFTSFWNIFIAIMGAFFYSLIIVSVLGAKVFNWRLEA